ncbi:hypothetical protein P175DRAFT_0526070 [Aspergillus ochraceoroseus IBT 24754]|uniref:Uncharacterized protein n=2 Tax=Aspergillus subgen. Nidulantes TaxID=2720870 RepID=A0A0F8X618_9EURO|nr:uncharacterized protein P175DRAFT_0526070 [Aspergillus ochraceoroseus IBT 24754]KKK25090.1 hypothetical protein ARAM_004569 [Aspergillus rambellii]PTU18313.1 hypothetical protein P175DRAFT_0526070 [Aspergillus ochraceoroseus IBT 24754]
MDVFYTYTYATAGWLSLQSITLLTVPQMITAILIDEARPATNWWLTQFARLAIEVYFARCLGLGLLTIAALTIMLTGSIPLTSTISAPVSTEEADPKAPYAVPTLMVTSVYHAMSASYAYTRYLNTNQGVFIFAIAGYSLIASIGLWCLLFGSDNGRISRRTGADKRTAGFPFKNSEAAKKHSGKIF